MRYLLFLLMLAGWAAVVPRAATAADPDLKWEAAAVKALADGDGKALRQLAADYRQLTPEARRDLSVRVRDDAVEFDFHGEFRGDQFGPEMLEYLASVPGKDYESLLVVGLREQDQRTRENQHCGEEHRSCAVHCVA